MLMPKRYKRRKQFRGRMTGKATRGNKLVYGDYGLVALEPCWMTGNQIEAARIAISRYTKRGGKLWINVFPHKPITKKPAEVRMGKGKGNTEFWVAVVKPNRVLFELTGVTEEVAREAMRLASHKLPIKTKFIVREGLVVSEYKKPAKVAKATEETVSEEISEVVENVVPTEPVITEEEKISSEGGNE